MTNNNIKIFIGPVTKNVANAVIAINNQDSFKIGLIPSRRQVEYNGGYVNNWTTKDFAAYIRKRSSLAVLQRDHGGPGQGHKEDDGLDSLKEDTKYMDIIHIDPWKKYPKYEDGLRKTIECLNFCHEENPNCCFEVGTEEAIKRFEPENLDKFLNDLKEKLPEKTFSKIVYAVIQSGTGLDLANQKNTGIFDPARLKKMILVCKKYGLQSKEHNGDYLGASGLAARFNLGLDAINIAPELGQVETDIYLNKLKNFPKTFFDEFYKVCYNSNRWKKWVSSDFDPEKEREKVIKISGHYVFSNAEFLKLKNKILKKLKIDELTFDNNIKKEIINYIFKLNESAN